ncbi:putative transcriptional regulator [Clostridium sp. CAG:505]|nr:putative transcriptional regulator [Clostridium sp. CAG:505]
MLMLLSLLAEKDCYGYEIIKEISARSQNVFQFKEGTLYPVLHRMESQNLVKSYRAKTESGKERKYYRITATGKAQLAEEKKQWETFCGSVERVIRGSGYAGTLGTVLE